MKRAAKEDRVKFGWLRQLSRLGRLQPYSTESTGLLTFTT